MKLTRYITVLILLGVGLCILGIALVIWAAVSINKCKTELETERTSSEIASDYLSQLCSTSKEAQRLHLQEQIEKVIDTYYSFYQHHIIWHPGYTEYGGDHLKKFRPYNCTPEALKERSDASRKLYSEVQQMKTNLNESLLRQRELKSIFQLIHYLKTNFGYPYGENYYAGDWMMGPSRFCSEQICHIGRDIKYHFNIKSWAWQPKTLADISYLIKQLKKYKGLIEQYVSNIKYGIQAGMVRSVEECEAGYHSFTRQFFQVTVQGERGILKETFARNLLTTKFLSKLRERVENKWLATTGKQVNESIRDTLIMYFGRPLTELIHYLRGEYRLHCVPSSVSSGLATLPLDYIYYNGTRTKNKTTKILPFGETLNGKEAYKTIMYFFTTIEDLRPDKVHELGQTRLKLLYPEVLKIAKNYSTANSTSSVAAFKEMLADQSSYFNDEPFPKNESGEQAFTDCVSLTKAKTSCPKRYRAFRKWTSFVRDVLSMLDPKTIGMFHFSGEKKTTSSCPLNVVPNFNPSTGSQSFTSAGAACLRPSRYNLPFFMDNYGPIYNAYSVAGHEGRPGHHTQIQGSKENFGDHCDDNVSWLSNQLFYSSFGEGWALYAENPLLAEGTDIYDNNPVQKYGMLKWQVWRALRLIVDTGLHYKGMKRSEALKLHAEYAWDTTDKATKDVTRYQSNPGQATAYMIGQLEIWNLRKLTKKKLEAAGKEFNEKDFHYQVLSQGQSPFGYLKIHINRYIECMVRDVENCDYVGNERSEITRNATMLNRNYFKSYPHRTFHLEHFD